MTKKHKQMESESDSESDLESIDSDEEVSNLYLTWNQIILFYVI